MGSKIVSLFEYRKLARPRANRAGWTTNRAREQFIRNQARDLLVRRWRKERAARKIELRDILPIKPQWVAELFTGWKFEEPEEIGQSRASGRDVAGALNRDAKVIEVVASLPADVRRFTGAHEIGHLVLHPELRSLRESPLTDEKIRSGGAPPKEKEANLFAAELLMPRKPVKEFFEHKFGEVIDRASIDEDSAFYWTDGRFRASQLQKKDPVELAIVIAGTSSFTTADSRALTEIFGVSAIAMAIQLVDLGLVV